MSKGCALQCSRGQSNFSIMTSRSPGLAFRGDEHSRLDELDSRYYSMLARDTGKGNKASDVVEVVDIRFVSHRFQIDMFRIDLSKTQDLMRLLTPVKRSQNALPMHSIASNKTSQLGTLIAILIECKFHHIGTI
jgi:hypothetical protein